MQTDYQTENSDTDSRDDAPDNIFLQKYNVEIQQLSSGIDEIQRRAVTGALRVSRLRSLGWAILLGAMPPEREKWLDAMRRNRTEYADLKERMTCNPHCCKLPEDNPLSQNDESVWNQHFRDNDLRSTIKLDVIRTFPGIEFFSHSEIQEAMVNVLFCFARETPSLVYRQGMHEILAPLLFVLQSDHRIAEQITLPDDITEIMDPKYLEHDSYTLFKIIMTGIEKFYTVKEISKLRRKPEHSNDSCKKKITDNDIINFIGDTNDNLLSGEDSGLAEYLRNCDISLSIFGIRWLRLLFGREFPLQDLLLLWDAIFAFTDFSLTGYIMVAMLIAIKSLLMESEAIMCLTHLMHYPPTVDVQYIIEHALYLKYPNEYCKPIPRNFITNIVRNPHIMHHRKIYSNKSINRSEDNQERTVISKHQVASPAEDGIIDGITVQESSILREELYYAQRIMTLGHTRLDQYEEILRQSISTSLPLSHPAYQALNGLKEISQLLKSRKGVEILPEVEPALEANESATPPSKGKQKPKTKPIEVHKPINNTKDVQMKVYKIINTNVGILGAPNLDPLGLHSD